MEMEEAALMDAFIEEYAESKKNEVVGKRVTEYETAPPPVRNIVKPKSNSIFDKTVARAKQTVENVKHVVNLAVYKVRPPKKKKVKVKINKTMEDIRREAKNKFSKMSDAQRLRYAVHLENKGKKLTVARNYAEYISEKAKREGGMSDRVQEMADQILRKETERERAGRAFMEGYGVGEEAREKLEKAEAKGLPKPKEVDYSDLEKSSKRSNEKGLENSGYANGRSIEDIKANET